MRQLDTGSHNNEAQTTGLFDQLTKDGGYSRPTQDDAGTLLTDGGADVPMVTSEGPIATAVAGPDPTAFERWERDRELRADGGTDLGVSELRENIEAGTIEDTTWVHDAIQKTDDHLLLHKALDLVASDSNLAFRIRDRLRNIEYGEPEDEPVLAVDEFVQLPVFDERVEHFEDSDRQWMVLFPEDFDNLMIDEPGNLALLIDEEQAREINRLSVKAIEQFEEAPDDA